MSHNNHEWVDGRLLQTDKRFSQLKQTQRERINGWLYWEYRTVFEQLGVAPDARYNARILDAVYIKIQEAQIWVPFGEVARYFYSRKNVFRKRYLKERDQ